MAIFRVKSHFAWRKSAAKFLWNCQRQSCRAFIGLSVCAKMIGGGLCLSRENLADTDPPSCKSRFSIYFYS